MMFIYETGLSERPHRMGAWASVRQSLLLL